MSDAEAMLRKAAQREVALRAELDDARARLAAAERERDDARRERDDARDQTERFAMDLGDMEARAIAAERRAEEAEGLASLYAEALEEIESWGDDLSSARARRALRSGAVADLGRHYVRYDSDDHFHTRSDCGPIVCGSTRGTLVCERPAGHDGNHSAWTKGDHGVFGHTNWEPDPTPVAAPATCTVEIVSGRYHNAFGVHERKKPCGLRLPCSIHGLAVSPTVPPADAPGRFGGKP